MIQLHVPCPDDPDIVLELEGEQIVAAANRDPNPLKRLADQWDEILNRISGDRP